MSLWWLVLLLFLTLWLKNVWEIYSVLESYQNEAVMDSSKVQKRSDSVPTMKLVSQSKFSSSLDSLQCSLAKPQPQFLYGSYDEITYIVGRESFVFLAGGRAALLQLAHPFIALGIEQHSNVKHGVQERFYRTFEYIFSMTYGESDEMFAAARSVRRLHDRVQGTFPETVGPFKKGSVYSAHWDQALFWVASTLTESSILIFEMMVRRLSLSEKHQFYANSRRFYALFGIPQEVIPRSWEEFLIYNRRMWSSNILTVGSSGLILKNFLLTPPRAVFWPLMRWVEITTAGMLPPRIRQQFKMKFGLIERIVFYSTFGFLRMIYAWLPASMRYVDRYLEMERKQGVKRMLWPSRISAGFARCFLRQVMPKRSTVT